MLARPGLAIGPTGSPAAPPAGPASAPSSRPDHEPAHVLEARWQTRLAHGVNRMFSRIYHRVTVESPLALPKRGAAILVCNHISGLDPLLLQSVTPRVIVWMMAREYYEIRAMKPFFRAIRAIPVDRSGRDSWRMPPLAMLAKPAMSAGRKAGLTVLRSYLAIAMILVVVRLVQMAIGH